MPFQDLAETERSNDWSGSLRLGVQRWKWSWYLSKVYMGCCTGDVYKQCDLKTSNYNFIYYHLQRFITFDSSIWIDRFLKLKIALNGDIASRNIMCKRARTYNRDSTNKIEIDWSNWKIEYHGFD